MPAGEPAPQLSPPWGPGGAGGIRGLRPGQGAVVRVPGEAVSEPPAVRHFLLGQRNAGAAQGARLRAEWAARGAR